MRLADLQAHFGAALRDVSRTCAVVPPANLSIYRNNSVTTFLGALASSFPVLKRRVGDAYFEQLAHLYRDSFPSRSGDLQWVGEHFAKFLDSHLRDGEYHWLTDLAALEWNCELATISPELPAIGPQALSQFAPEELERLVFELQPSLRLLFSPFPVFSVWAANQVKNAPPVDQSPGEERGLSRIRRDSIEIQQLPADTFSLCSAMLAGAPLGAAMTVAHIEDGARLTAILGMMFSTGLVCVVRARHE